MKLLDDVSWLVVYGLVGKGQIHGSRFAISSAQKLNENLVLSNKKVRIENW